MSHIINGLLSKTGIAAGWCETQSLKPSGNVDAVAFLVPREDPQNMWVVQILPEWHGSQSGL